MRHEMTERNIMTKTKTKTMTKTNTFREHSQREIIETCDLWDIWSEWLWDIFWPKKDHEKDKYKDKDNDKDKYIYRAHSKSDLRDLRPLRHMIRVVMRYVLTKKTTWQRQIQRQRQWQRQIHLENTFKEWS